MNMDPKLKAVRNNAMALAAIPEEQRTFELCVEALQNYKLRALGMVLEYVPEKFKTKELCFEAVREDGHALTFVDVGKLTKEEYTEICRLSLERK